MQFCSTTKRLGSQGVRVELHEFNDRRVQREGGFGPQVDVGDVAVGHIDVIAQLHPSPRAHGHTRHGRCEQIKTRAGVSTAGTEIVPPDNTGLGHHAGNKMQAATTLCQSCGGT